jgi:hypothetical protein
VDLDSRQKAGYVREETREKRETALPEPMGKTMKIEGMKSRIAEKRFYEASGRWISIEDRLNISL